jgi:hypothetical protein
MLTRLMKNTHTRSKKRSDRSKQVNLRTIYPTYLINNFLREYDKRTTGGNNIGFTT